MHKTLKSTCVNTGVRWFGTVGRCSCWWCRGWEGGFPKRWLSGWLRSNRWYQNRTRECLPWSCLLCRYPRHRSWNLCLIGNNTISEILRAFIFCPQHAEIYPNFIFQVSKPKVNIFNRTILIILPFKAGGPSWDVLLGRRDGRTANRGEAVTALPLGPDSLEILTSKFSVHNLDTTDLVALSGNLCILVLNLFFCW